MSHADDQMKERASRTDEELAEIDVPSDHELSTEELGRWFQLNELGPSLNVVSLAAAYDKIKFETDLETHKTAIQAQGKSTAKNPVTLIQSSLLLDKVTFEKDLLFKRGKPIALDDLAREIYLNLKGQAVTVTKSDVYDVIVQKKYEARESRLVELRTLLTYNASKTDLKRWVRAVSGDCQNQFLIEAVVGHFIWQVKRKLHGLEVGHHLMPILTGRQGSGKSTAIYKLLEPLAGFSVTLDVSACNDPREYYNFQRNLVCFFDELARADRTDVNSLKKVITAPILAHRILGTHQSSTAPNMATFIGATNGSIAEMIYDPTGMRRFFEVPTQDLIDREIVNSIDYQGIWKGIDESVESPILSFLSEISTAQDPLRARDVVEEFLEEREVHFIKPNDDGPDTYETTPTGIHSLYKEWCQDLKRTPVSLAKFGRRIKELGGVQTKNAKSERVYRYRGRQLMRGK